MKRFYLSALYMLLGFAQFTFSQEINLGSRITALGNIGVALRDEWSLQSNPAGINETRNPMISLAYRNSYMNPEISTQSAILIYPIGRNIAGISIQNYGFSAYSEQKVGFSFCKTFGPALSLALSTNLHQVQIQQYGSTRTYSVELGVQYQLNKRLLLGSHIGNPSASAFDAGINASIPMSLAFGASYLISEKVLLNSGIIKLLDAPTDVRCGLEYSVLEAVFLRGGIAVQPFRQFAGVGYRHKSIKMDTAVASHPQLGFSPQLSFSYEF